MLNPSFNRKIRRIIEILKYPMYIVIRNKKLKCTCVDKHTIPDPNCPKCLGTGNKIKIKKTFGAMEPDDVSIRMSGQQNKVTSNYYYFDSKDVSKEMMQTDNIIVRGEEADFLQTPKLWRSDSNDEIYYYVEAVNMKSNLQIFLKNFYRIVGKEG